MDNGSELYRRFLDGDDEGLVGIIRDYKDGLILYIYGIVGNIQDAEALAEDTFVRIAVRRPKDRGKASFRTWLYTIGRNIALDHLRKRKRNGTVPLESLPETEDGLRELEESYLRKEKRAVINCAMEKLKPEYRQVLWLAYFEGFSLRDTAKLMGKSVHAAETLAWRARQSLKKLLEEE